MKNVQYSWVKNNKKHKLRRAIFLCFFVFFFLFFVCLFVCFCFVLFCFVLFCFVLFCFVLFCFLFCFVLFCFVTLTGEVKLSITLEPNVRFEWDKKYIKEKIPGYLDIPKLEN